MFRGTAIRLLLLIGIFGAHIENKEALLREDGCQHGCQKIFNSIFIETNIEQAKKEIDNAESPCKYFYKWFIDTYIDFNIKEGVESLYRSLYSTCQTKELAYLVYASKMEKKHTIIGTNKEIIYYYREVARQVFNEFFKKRLTLFAKWEFADLEKQGENKKIINFIKTLKNSGDILAAENLLSLIKIGHVELEPHIDFLKELARKGNAEAMGLLGNMYYYGWGVTPSKITARHYFAEGAKSNDPDSLNGLGMIYVSENNLRQGKIYLEKAVVMGSQAADYNLYLMHETSNSFIGELHLIKSAKQDGYLPAVYTYAEKSLKNEEYRSSTISQYRSIAVYHSKVLDLEKQAIQSCRDRKNTEAFYLSLLIGDLGSKTGYANAAYILKNRILKVPYRTLASLQWLSKKTKKAAKEEKEVNKIYKPEVLYILLCKRIAETENSQAMVELGSAYYYGTGVEKDLEKAFSRYYAASLMESAEGDYCTGWMYEMGSGLTKDYSLAKTFYKQMYAREENTYLLYWVLISRLFIKMNLAKIISAAAVSVCVLLGWLTLPQTLLLVDRKINRPATAVPADKTR